jgi:DNA replication and repair protein RecF
MIERGEEVGRVAGELSTIKFQMSNQDQSQNEKTTLEVMVTSGVVVGQKAPIKKYLVNGIARRSFDFASTLKAVLFSPEDLDLVRGSPGHRRRYLDFILIQTDREYRRSLGSYERGIRQRNRLLEKIRDGEANRTQLYFWDQLVIKNGEYISAAREALIAAINATDKPFGNFHIVYDHSYISAARLTQYAEAEIGAAVTLVGPHRDDITFLDDEREMAKFGSRGEQRLTVLWLKLAELVFIQQKTVVRPILLLDDIFSELDHQHRDEVLKIIDQQQTVMTTTDIHFVPENIANGVEVVKLT